MYKKLALFALTLSFLAFPTRVLAVCATCQAVTASSQNSLQNTLQNTVQNTIQEQRQATLENMKANLAQRREEFRVQLTELKDQRKALILQRVSDNLDKVNSKFIAHFYLVLERLTAILSKIEVRADLLEADGLDVSLVRSATTKAETAIEIANNAVASQEANVYEIDISDETQLGINAGATMQELRADLAEVRVFINSARQSVVDALKSLETILLSE